MWVWVGRDGGSRPVRLALRVVLILHAGGCAQLKSIVPACPSCVWLAQESIQNDVIEWLRFLKNSIGFDGWRFDFVRGYDGRFVKIYTDATVSVCWCCGCLNAVRAGCKQGPLIFAASTTLTDLVCVFVALHSAVQLLYPI